MESGRSSEDLEADKSSDTEGKSLTSLPLLTSLLPPGPDSPSPPCSPLPTMLPSEEEEGAPVPRYSAKFTDNVTKVRIEAEAALLPVSWFQR